MTTIRRVVNNQVEVSTTLSKATVTARIGNLNSQLIELNRQISDLQGRVAKITSIRDELQSLTNQIIDVIIER